MMELSRNFPIKLFVFVIIVLFNFFPIKREHGIFYRIVSFQSNCCLVKKKKKLVSLDNSWLRILGYCLLAITLLYVKTENPIYIVKRDFYCLAKLKSP